VECVWLGGSFSISLPSFDNRTIDFFDSLVGTLFEYYVFYVHTTEWSSTSDKGLYVYDQG
jgi:hypothetical protein